MTAPARAARLLSPAMLGVASGAVLVPLNSTMLAVALPSIMDEFGVDAVTVSSLVTLYLGAVTIALLASGSLGDRYGQRRVFLVGVVAFALSSLLAAVAPSFELLAAARVLQALSGALISTTSVALVRAMAPADRRGAAFGLFDMLVSTSAAIGPFIGGLLVGAFGWRSLFVHRRAGRARSPRVVGRCWSCRPTRTRRRHRGRAAGPLPRTAGRIDVPGLVLLAAVLIALLVAIRGLGDGEARLGLRSRRSPSSRCSSCSSASSSAAERPAVDPRLFASRPFTAAVLGVLGATVVLHAAFILVPLLVERLAGRDGRDGRARPARDLRRSGAIAAPFGGRLSDRVGRRLPVVAGSLVPDGRAGRALAVRGRTAPPLGDRRRCSAWSGSGWASPARRARRRRMDSIPRRPGRDGRRHVLHRPLPRRRARGEPGRAPSSARPSRRPA